MRKPFQFKQFSIIDTHCAMKLSTDAVLLGAWAETGNSKRILDIGTGSGIIAIMLAQRSPAQITAIDIHSASCEDAALNFTNCHWKERLQLHNLSFSDFVNDCSEKYDLIVSNPPFHNKSLKSPSEKVNLSKHTTALTHEELITGVKKILLPEGRFCIIQPNSELQNFRQLAFNEGFFIRHECFVYPKKGKPANRMLIELVRFCPEEIRKSEITIRNSIGDFHESYIEMTKDFYLHF
jgi:tRNA1Val (adenine37-N6)-methyltransferase